MGERGFFVGYHKRLPRHLRGFLAGVGAGLIGGFAGLALLLAVTVDDPGDGRFAGDLGVQKLTGILEMRPYPVLRTRRDGASHALMLSGVGKRGVQEAAAPLDGRSVEATGFLLKRGSLDMLQVDGLRAVGEATAAPARVPQGRWRLTGEICDGKCWTGAMQPGSGLAHRACASLCVVGGIPPVFVSTGPVEGRSFFLLAGPDGGPLPDRFRDLMALPIEVEGSIETVDDLPVLAVDLEHAKVL